MQLLRDDESAQIQDAVKFVATALDKLVAAGKTLTPPPASCRETTQWNSGQTLFKWVSLMLLSVSSDLETLTDYQWLNQKLIHKSLNVS